MERDDFKFADDLVVIWEYTDGVPILGVFLPKFLPLSYIELHV
ncbi:hypothetical protein L798_10351 [Zootermopsis nevadensis]|uniref:Uncharacterized protein n=1 Tax=Zootermopsis nevadensis TaxID=136037 RepID=A0A067R1Y0_ZOONE|nr:hypothetical protein L798_10351 [Zootermopsis nevadensis]